MAVHGLALEQYYHAHFPSGGFDLSSSSPEPTTASRILSCAGVDPATLLDRSLGYEPNGGSEALRSAIADLYDGIGPEHVLVTAGASEAIQAVAMAIVSPGDAVAVQVPSYGALRQAPAQLGARIVEWLPEDGLQFDAAALDGPAFGGVSSVFLNTPHGPSGSVLRGRASRPMRIVADEVYRGVDLAPGTGRPSVIDEYEDAVSIGDLSKPLGLGGLRLGWIVTRDRRLLAACAAALDCLSGSVSALSAPVALAALRSWDELLSAHLDRARANLSLLASFVEQHREWVDWVPPQAGYTAFLRFRGGQPGEIFYEWLRNRGVFALDGAVYGWPDHTRIGFGLESPRFADALETFGEELRRLVPATAMPPRAADVILLAKEPRSGFSKTRLAAGVGAARAAELSTAFLEDSIAIARTHARKLFIAYAPDAARSDFEAMVPDATYLSQGDGDFGGRLDRAFATAFAAGAYRPVLIGSDSPTLPAHLIAAARRLLATHDIVLGPATDGGYYLIAMNKPHPQVFEGIDWGTSRVLAQTLRCIQRAGLSCATLPYWYDVDVAADLGVMAADPLLRSATAAALAAGERASAGVAAL